ncbi:MAG: hypothetical protein PHF74_05560 [Dehalococcoidales bacterium]|nr:hypothetical protein [Dehalococcoidales bacterium]
MDIEIIEVRNSKAIPVFAEIASKMKDWDYKYEDMLIYFENRFGLPEFKIYAEAGMHGIMAIQAVMPVAERFVSIELLWTDHKVQGLTKAFIDIAEAQAKKWDIHKLFTTLRRPSLMKRYANKAEAKYGFTPYAITAIKEIGG